MGGFRISALGPDRAGELCRLHLSAFPKNKLRYTIYSSKRVENYLAEIMKTEPREFHGLFSGSRLIGYFQLRAAEDVMHWNYVATSPDYQGQGAGKQAFARIESLTREAGLDRITLDVQGSNQGPGHWYAALGFRPLSTTRQFLVAETRHGSGSSLRVTLSSAAKDNFTRFGFCYLSAGGVNVGMIGDHLFHLRDNPSVDLVRALQDYDGARETLLVLPENEAPVVAAEHVDDTIRMQLRL